MLLVKDGKDNSLLLGGQVEQDNLVIDFGLNSDKKITYIILKLNKQRELETNFKIGGKYLTSTTVKFEELIYLLNRAGMLWEFSSFDKLIRVSLSLQDHKTTFVFEFYEEPFKLEVIEVEPL